MRAEVRSIYSSDVDVETYASLDPAFDGLWVRLVVGPAGERGEESFDVLVCTPLWLGHVVAENGPQLGHGHLVVEPFDLTVANEFLRDVVERMEAPDWPSLAQKLARLSRWEFEDYH